MNKSSFFDKCKGISLVLSSTALLLFAFAAILFSTAPAQADVPQTMYATGKYQMQLNTVITNTNAAFWYVLVWDSETGRSKLYYGNLDDGMNVAHSMYQIPSSPL